MCRVAQSSIAIGPGSGESKEPAQREESRESEEGAANSSAKEQVGRAMR
jgi:hypothetical protein